MTDLTRRAFFGIGGAALVAPVVGFVLEDHSLTENNGPPTGIRFGRTKVVGRIRLAYDELRDRDAVRSNLELMITDVYDLLAKAEYADDYPYVEAWHSSPWRPETRFLPDSPASGRSRYMQPVMSKWIDEDGDPLARVASGKAGFKDQFEGFWRMFLKLTPEPSCFHLTKPAIRNIIYEDAKPLFETLKARGRLPALMVS